MAILHQWIITPVLGLEGQKSGSHWPKVAGLRGRTGACLHMEGEAGAAPGLAASDAQEQGADTSSCVPGLHS